MAPSTIVILGVVLVVSLLVDRLLLRAEERGWIYYRHKRASPGTRAAAALELQAFLEPRTAYHAEALREPREEEDDDAGPPKGGGR